MKNASLELNQPKELPVSSYKWTWREKLTEDEVIKLCQVGTKPGHVQHSGYNISLLEGKPTREYSKSTGGAVQSTMTYDSLPAETSFIPPPTYLKFPQYFSDIEHQCIYNPFQ